MRRGYQPRGRAPPPLRAGMSWQFAVRIQSIDEIRNRIYGPFDLCIHASNSSSEIPPSESSSIVATSLLQHTAKHNCECTQLSHTHIICRSSSVRTCRAAVAPGRYRGVRTTLEARISKLHRNRPCQRHGRIGAACSHGDHTYGQHSTAQHSTAQHSTAQHRRHGMAWHDANAHRVRDWQSAESLAMVCLMTHGNATHSVRSLKRIASQTTRLAASTSC
jgi:hypothetical protein